MAKDNVSYWETELGILHSGENQTLQCLKISSTFMTSLPWLSSFANFFSSSRVDISNPLKHFTYFILFVQNTVLYIKISMFKFKNILKVASSEKKN